MKTLSVSTTAVPTGENGTLKDKNNADLFLGVMSLMASTRTDGCRKQDWFWRVGSMTQR